MLATETCENFPRILHRNTKYMVQSETSSRCLVIPGLFLLWRASHTTETVVNTFPDLTGCVCVNVAWHLCLCATATATSLAVKRRDNELPHLHSKKLHKHPSAHPACVNKYMQEARLHGYVLYVHERSHDEAAVSYVEINTAGV